DIGALQELGQRQVARSQAGRHATSLVDHLVSAVEAAPLERDPYCHIHVSSCFPAQTYDQMLDNLPAPAVCTPFNLKRYRRSNGESTRDEFHITNDNLTKLTKEAAALWGDVRGALSSTAFRRAVFSKLAPDLADRFGISQSAVADLHSECQVYL